jgi:glycosyltransferase involved in cell wall biosynthesis
MLHNRYQIEGGEDVSARTEAELLRQGGHHIDYLEFHNDEVAKIGAAATALRAIWSRPALAEVHARLKEGVYDVLHVQNNFPLISPAVLRIARQYGTASVQALRNYRLLCANAQFFRNDSPCQKCLGALIPWAGIAHRCYRGSTLGSATVAAMIGTHKLLGTWRHYTDAFIAVSDYTKDLYIKGGFNPARIYTKSNVLLNPALEKINVSRPAKLPTVVYVGRLAAEKGLHTLTDAWVKAKLPHAARLLIIGEGPEQANLQAFALQHPSIVMLGKLSMPEVLRHMAEAQAVVVPSVWAEPFGRVVIEAYAVGTPVLAAQSGALPELLQHTPVPGRLFPPHDSIILKAHLEELFDNTKLTGAMAEAAREVYATHYRPAANLKALENIYAQAMRRVQQGLAA